MLQEQKQAHSTARHPAFVMQSEGNECVTGALWASPVGTSAGTAAAPPAAAPGGGADGAGSLLAICRLRSRGVTWSAASGKNHTSLKTLRRCLKLPASCAGPHLAQQMPWPYDGDLPLPAQG